MGLVPPHPLPRPPAHLLAFPSPWGCSAQPLPVLWSSKQPLPGLGPPAFPRGPVFHSGPTAPPMVEVLGPITSAKTFLHCIHAFQRPGRGVFGGCCPNHSRPAFQPNCRTLADGRKHFCTEACQPGSRSILKAPFCVPEGEIDHPQMTRPADQGWRGHVICGGTAPHRRLLAGRRGTGCHHPSPLVRLPCHKRDSQAPGPS